MSEEIELSGWQVINLKRPCIYIWWRKKECLYVGLSTQGLVRVIGHHHVIGVTIDIEPNDLFIVIYPEISVDTSLELWELRYIDKYKPLLNKTTYGKKLNGDKLSDVQENVQTKEELAEVLFGEMSEQRLVVDPRNSSEEELREFIAKGTAWKRKYNQYLKAN